MTIKTLQFIEVDSDPLNFGGEYLQPEWVELARSVSPLADALTNVIDSPEAADCDQCGNGIGYYLEEADDGRLEHAYWHYTALILHEGHPAIRLCEDCAAPVIQPPSLPLRQHGAHGAWYRYAGNGSQT